MGITKTMKTTEEIFKTPSIYLNGWKSKLDVITDFQDYENRNEEYLTKKYKDINILFASYGYENYSGDAWVLLEKDSKLYEVHGSHCSCYGLENQWKEEEVVLKELENRLVNGTFGQDDCAGNEFSKELKQFLGIEGTPKVDSKRTV